MSGIHADKAAAISNIDRLLSNLLEGSLAHRLAVACKITKTDTPAGAALKKIVDDRDLPAIKWTPD
jgi:hypothetical protein